MKITRARRGRGARFGARKYGKVGSHSDGRKSYDVAKVRIKDSSNYTYRCTCPHFFYRQQICKHIIEFKEAERLQKEVG